MDYTLGGRHYQTQGQDGDNLLLASLPTPQTVELTAAPPNGFLRLRAWQNGRYRVQMASGQTWQANILSVPAAQTIGGPWTLAFPASSGTPTRLTLPRLVSWSEQGSAAAQDFSGTAVYRTTFAMPP